MKSWITRAAAATGSLLAGLATALPALFALALLPLLLVLLPFVPDAMRPVRALADRERSRLSTSGRPVLRPYRPIPPPSTSRSHAAAVRTVFSDPATWRDLIWLLTHGLGWTITTVLAVALWPAVLVSLVLPIIWQAYPPGTFTAMLILIRNWPQALTLPFLQAICYAALVLFVVPPVTRWWIGIGRSLLRPTSQAALTGELQRVTETRTAALESHGAELRRIERDLHDGVQAQLVNISVRLGLADRALHSDPAAAGPLITDARTGIEEVLGELRGIIRGIYPPILTDRGLAGAIRALAVGRDFPVEVRIADDLPRLPAPVEAAAYFVVAEALTNTTKHGAARSATVIIAEADGLLLITVGDDGRGGADETRGTGLIGIRRRVAALDGRFALDSPAGRGTTIEVRLPCES
ncbi:sensor histidine kinase [Microlunatus soli]|uniref:histidine kinase n=1 Tax=Microlunatus soli TaxID=630515 RepID=A0A1H1P8J3_9ACTN|nr:sensor domain-containing protein [Microlunatus soli]SDS07571.1 Signal transduction histidine kinase [Microlunatus soli]